MERRLKELKDKIAKEIESVKDSGLLEEIRIKYLGRKGELTKILKNLKDLTEEERPKIGQLANQVKEDLTKVFRTAETVFKNQTKQNLIFDPTMPGTEELTGSLHPSTIIQYELETAFMQMGFTVYDGPQVESDYYNFTALNTPENHPARDTQDTFHLEDGNLLRTQTSNLQVRMLENTAYHFEVFSRGDAFVVNRLMFPMIILFIK